MAKVSKDKLFAKKRRLVRDFTFRGKTAVVFDDMLNRSVPFYAEMQRMVGEIATDFAVEGTNVYDLGCSTGNTFLALDPMVAKGVRFVGIDSSPEMLQKAREKLNASGMTRDVELVCADLNQGVQITNASMAILNLTLQFVRPLNRHRLFIKYYYAFKERNGYSQMEISQKREALENVLVPYRVEENMALLLENGFSECEPFFKWYNFCGFIALK